MKASIWIFSIILGHLFVGFITAILICLLDMRRKPYDEYFFDSDTKETILGLTLYGYLTPIIVFIVYIQDKFKNRTHKKRITKFLYHVANIGVSKSEKDTFLNAGYTLDDEKRDKVYGDILYDGEDFL